MIDFENGKYLKLVPVGENDVQDVQKILIPQERIQAAFKGMRDYVVFTDKRLITVNIQGMTGKKKDYTTIPYSKITAFSVETSGPFDMDSELELWLSGLGQIILEFTGHTDMTSLSRILAAGVL